MSHAAAGNVTRAYSYGKSGGAQPDTMTAVTQTGPSGSRAESYTYDAAGNQTGRTIAGVSQTLDWDAEGRVTSITQGTATTGFVYDADGSRLMRRDPSGTTLYLPGGQELRVTIGSNAVKGTRYYAFDGDVVAVRTATGVSFTFSDHQGTGQWAVQEGTLAFAQRRFTPFGASRGPAVGTWVGEKGFVGGTNDSSTGLTHLGARLYDPAVGRFVSVDPLFDATDPQTWNGYAYANNSPITFSDATGLSFWSNIVDAVKKVFEVVRKLVSGDDGRRAAAAEEVSNTRRKHEEQKERIKKVATEIIKIAADELGITAAVDCFSSGDMGACAETAVTVLSSFVGGLAGKLLGKYGAPWNWRKGYELAQRLYRLGSEAVDSIGGWFNTRRDLEKAEKAYEAVQSSCSGSKVGNSFAPGTPVVLSDGSVRPIEQLAPGDEVLATDPATGQSAGRPVVATIVGRGEKSLVTVTVAGATSASVDGRGAAPLVATDKHPFWVPDRAAWVDAADLVVGDVLRTPDGSTVRVTSVRAWTALAQVHNLTVQGIHTYYVLAGRTPVLVHNCNFGAGEADKKYDKHVLGHDDDGNPTRTPDMPEYDREGGFEDYVSDAQKLMCSSTCPAGAREVVRSDNTVIRMDSRGRVGMRQGGRITTYYRPDNAERLLELESGR